MKKQPIALALMLLLSIPGSALAAVVYVTGSGQSHDPGVALANARADAIAECTAQGGTPVVEVYNHVSRAALWLASSVWKCETP
ncbi:hypothetical protein OV207_18660 [Corallococcus sp. BB11-1]|uniref:hypothetical protein n=1 Tax=Corallococcus sp. BB11-1 TaxID=2996783 RepID=UPI0022711B54|nr:hypothetical protein [Corallococcus sp. BB11-1]MCY1033481.1 hypothetical protein [Corallococcus sp. BB11-1]